MTKWIAATVMIALIAGCSIKARVPDFEYPDTETRADWQWPKLGPTEDLDRLAEGQGEARQERTDLDLDQSERAAALAALEEEINRLELDPDALEARAELLRRKREELANGG